MKKFFRFKVLLTFMLILPVLAFVFLTVHNSVHLDDRQAAALPALAEQAEQVSDQGTLQTALAKIPESNEGSPLTINFSDLKIDTAFDEKTITLTTGYVTFTGSVSSTEDLPIFKIAPSSSGSHFVFDLKMTSTASEKSVAILFDDTAAENLATVELGTNIDTDYKNLCNYVSGNYLTLASGSISTSSVLNILYPYDCGSNMVIQNYSTSLADKIKVVSENPELYSIETHVNSGNLSANAAINIEFKDSKPEGTSETKTFHFNEYYEFPRAATYSYDHHTFVGWVPKIELDDGETYYIENDEASVTSLEENEGTGLKSELVEVDPAKTFNYYSATPTELVHRVVEVFLSKGKVPTFELLWADVEYTVVFDAGEGVLDGEQHSVSVSGTFGETITVPDSPSRYGYKFDGWKIDGSNEAFSQATFNQDYNLHASWIANNYSIEFYQDVGDDHPVSTINFTINDEIIYPTGLSKEGYTFNDVWLTEDELVFDADTMLDDFEEVDGTIKIVLHAKWDLRKFIVSIYSTFNMRDPVTSRTFDYNTTIVPSMLPQIAATVGYSFDQFYMDRDFTIPLTSFVLKGDINIYARFTLIPLEVHFCYGYDDIEVVRTVGYNYPIILPLDDMTRTNYIFDGWFADEELTEPFVSGTLMTSDKIYIYAKWLPKKQVQIDNSTQKYIANNINSSFTEFSNLSGFTVEYLINGSWSSLAPMTVGAYDVRISRAEDNVYASFETILEGAYVVEPEIVDITWAIALLLVIFMIEIIVCVLLKIMKRLKTNLSLSVAFLPFMSMFFSNGTLFLDETRAISTLQLVLLILSAILALVGFVVMIVFIYRLHRTVPALLYDDINATNKEGGEEDARMAPKDTANDEVIKSKIDTYLSDFETDRHGYVKGSEVSEQLSNMNLENEDQNSQDNETPDNILNDIKEYEDVSGTDENDE